MELIDESEIYQVEHPSGTKFKLRHWTRGMQDEVDTRCIVSDGKGGFSFNVALEREIKIDRCLADWDGVTARGEPVPCAPENRRRLPVGVFVWLIQKIDEAAGLRITADEKKS